MQKTRELTSITSDFRSPARYTLDDSSDQLDQHQNSRPNYSANVILEDPNADKHLSVNAKLTTNAGISVSYVAPALPRSAIVSSSRSGSNQDENSETGWDTIEESESDDFVDEAYNSFLRPYGKVLLDDQDNHEHNEPIEETESDDFVDEAYKSFLRPYGQVLLDPDLDFEPQVMVGQDNIDQDDTIEEESNDILDKVYKSFLRPYGQVLLDPPNTEFEFGQNPESGFQDNDEGHDDTANNDLLIDNYPSSWEEDEQNDDLIKVTVSKNKEPCRDRPNFSHSAEAAEGSAHIEKFSLRPKIETEEEHPWSDIGQSVNSSFEFWKAKNKLKAVQRPKLYETKYRHNNKYASDSNINDEAVDMTEPGLRKIPKEAIYSTTDQERTSSGGTPHALEDSREFQESADSDKSEHVYYSINEDLDHQGAEGANQMSRVNVCLEDYTDDNIYESVELEQNPNPDLSGFGQQNPESGFFSGFDHRQPGIEPGQILGNKKITCIPVNQRPSSSSDDYVSCHVTVNGKLWINPFNKDITNEWLNPSANKDTNPDSDADQVLTTNTHPVLTKWGLDNLLLYFFFPTIVSFFSFLL